MPKNPELNVTAVDDKILTPLQNLSTCTDQRVIERLIELIISKGINFTKIEASDTHRSINLLVEAMKVKNSQLVRMLSELATEDEVLQAKTLAERAVDHNDIYVAIDEHAPDHEEPMIQKPSRTIHDIIKTKDIDALTQLLAASPAEVNSIEPGTNYTPAETAILQHWLEGLKLLVEKGADQSKLLDGALFIANEEIIKYVVDDLKLCTREECMLTVILDSNINALRAVIATIGGCEIRLSAKGTALHHATDEEKTEIISALIGEHEADKEAKNDKGDTPLQHAVRASKEQSTSTLIAYQANVKALTPEGENLLHIVTDCDIASKLMGLPEKNELMMQKDYSGNLPIHSAVLNKKNDICAVMLNNCDSTTKAEVLAARSSDQKSILEMTGQNNPELTKMLIEHGAQEIPCNVQMLNAEQAVFRELINAVYTDNESKIRKILAENNKLELLNTKFFVENSQTKISLEFNIMQYALANNKLNALSTLKEFWLHPALNNLMEAIINDDYADINNIITNNPILLLTKLSIAKEVIEIPVQAAKIVENNNVSVYLHFDADKNNMNLLHLATYLNNCEAACALMEQRINPNEQDSNNGYTALHYAINQKQEQEGLVSILLHSTDHTLRTFSNSCEETPYEMAAFLGKQTIIMHMLNTKLEDADKYILLLKALRGKQISIIKNILEVAPELLSMSSKTTGIHALMEITKLGNIDLFEFCLAERFTLHIKQLLGRSDIYAKNLLHYIAEYGSDKEASILKKAYPDHFNKLVQMIDDQGKLPIHIAAKNKNEKDFNELYPILDHMEQKIAIKKQLFSKKLSEIQSKSVLTQSDKDLSNHNFYQHYHNAVTNNILSTEATYVELATKPDLQIDLSLHEEVNEMGALLPNTDQ